jgi:hypothetical protein
VTFSGSALSTLPKVHNHVPKKRPQRFKLGRFVEVRECSIATKAVGSDRRRDSLIALLPSAVPVLTLRNSAPRPAYPRRRPAAAATKI